MGSNGGSNVSGRTMVKMETVFISVVVRRRFW